MKVLYLYAGPRKKVYDLWKKGLEPDTQLIGLNYMGENGIDARFLENRSTEFFRRISFNLTQLPGLFQFRRYDLVFSGAGLATLFLVKYVLRWKRPRWVMYNTYLSNVLQRNASALKGWFVRKAVFAADAIVSPSRAQAEYLRAAGLPERKNFYVPYGVDGNFYLSGAADRPERLIPERYIFSAGRDVGRDYKTLLAIADDLPAKVVIAAPPRSFKDISHMPKNVLINYFPASSMPNLYANAELSVIPTIAEEKLKGSDCSGQYVLLESMVSARAVVTSARTTLPDYFTSGEDGITVPPEDAAALKQAIVRLLLNPGEAQAFGKHAQAKALSLFATKRFAADLARVFCEVVEA